MGIGAGGHGNQTVQKGLHSPITWKFDSEVERLAFQPSAGLPALVSQLDAEDIDKWGYQASDNTYWALTGVSPLTWLQVNLANVPHSTSHEVGGGDELDVTGLSGLLADPQTPSAHAATHLPGGADALATAVPTQGIGGGNAEGTAASFARSNHNHAIRETSGPTDLTVAAIADGQAVGRSGSTLRGFYPLATVFSGGASMGGGDVGKYFGSDFSGGNKNASLSAANQNVMPFTGTLRRLVWMSDSADATTVFRIVANGVTIATIMLTGASGTVTLAAAVTEGVRLAVAFDSGTPPANTNVQLYASRTP